jgi:predicted glycoside hydrolase/deacetylase ChbG (UPF0249 family)
MTNLSTTAAPRRAHLTLVGAERPLSPASEIPSLLDRSGAFVNSFRGFTLRASRGALDPQQIELELRRQIEAVIAAGLRPLHLNSHQHVHVLPAVCPVVLRLGRRILRSLGAHSLREAPRLGQRPCFAFEAGYRWGYRWETETRALCDPEARAALAEAGVRLCGFRELD